MCAAQTKPRFLKRTGPHLYSAVPEGHDTDAHTPPEDAVPSIATGAAAIDANDLELPLTSASGRAPADTEFRVKSDPATPTNPTHRIELAVLQKGALDARRPAPEATLHNAGHTADPSGEAVFVHIQQAGNHAAGSHAAALSAGAGPLQQETLITRPEWGAEGWEAGAAQRGDHEVAISVGDAASTSGAVSQQGRAHDGRTGDLLAISTSGVSTGASTPGAFTRASARDKPGSPRTGADGAVDRTAGGERGSRSRAATQETDEDDELCIICFERPGRSVLLDCGHSGFCRTCANRIFVGAANECPTCRSTIRTIVDVPADAAVGATVPVT